MSDHLDVAFLPELSLDRDKRAFRYLIDRLEHQESCAALSMYGNGKDYLFSNIVRHIERNVTDYQLKVLNTVSADELRDFAASLEADDRPTLCLVNLRIRQDVSWFIEAIEALRIRRGRAFVSFVSSYTGDVYRSLRGMKSPVVHATVILKRVTFDDAQHIMAELSERFGFHPSTAQVRDIFKWSYGHVGLLRTLYLLKREAPERMFTLPILRREPTLLERLTNIMHDLPPEAFAAIQEHRLSLVERLFFEEFGYIDADGKLFHPLLEELLSDSTAYTLMPLSSTEQRVLDYLRAHARSVVSRQEVAAIVWGEEEWQDKYSDWAIGQLIYRLRKKLEVDAPGMVIETRKGQGFVLAVS